jgi:hypothetical protein
MEPQSLLLADLQHFGGSMLKNEEVGEKRFDFFITLVTAVIAGLVALASSSSPVAKSLLWPTTQWSLGILLVLGVLSYLRMLHRNRVTDDYQQTLKKIRDTFKTQCAAALGDYGVPVRSNDRLRKWLKGGYAETIGVMDGFLLAGLLWCRGLSRGLAITIGVLFSAALWIMACVRNK